MKEWGVERENVSVKKVDAKHHPIHEFIKIT